MSAAVAEPHTYYAARLTRAEADRLYLVWHPKVEDEVRAARAAISAPPNHEALFAALSQDLLAADLWPTPAPPVARAEPAEGSPQAGVANAARFLREAARAYAQQHAERALWLLQQATLAARAATTSP